MPSLILTTPAAKAWHKEYSRYWNKCKACPLHNTATKHVLFRGRLPADLLFIGEAPGSSEDAIGVPFIGPAGKVLDALLEHTFQKMWENKREKFSYAIGNVCCCIPLADPLNRLEGVRPPTPAEATACRPHLEDLLYQFPFKGVVLMGRSAQEHTAPLFDPNTSLFGSQRILKIYHPAYLKRKGGPSPKNQEFKNTVQQLYDFATQVLS